VVSDVEKWTPRVGDRVRVNDGRPWEKRCFNIVSLHGDKVDGNDGVIGFSLFPVKFLTLIKAAPAPPIAYVKQTRPEVPYDLRTPYQQRGWAL
jgi:hypothetical protein